MYVTVDHNNNPPYTLTREGAHVRLLHTGAVMQDLAMEQHSTWNGLALNHLYRGYPATFQVINWSIYRIATDHTLHHFYLVSESIILYISANVNSLQP